MLKIIEYILGIICGLINRSDVQVQSSNLEQSRKRQQDLINEIERLRTINTDDAHDKADILRKQLLYEKQRIKHLSAIDSKPES